MGEQQNRQKVKRDSNAIEYLADIYWSDPTVKRRSKNWSEWASDPMLWILTICTNTISQTFYSRKGHSTLNEAETGESCRSRLKWNNANLIGIDYLLLGVLTGMNYAHRQQAARNTKVC